MYTQPQKKFRAKPLQEVERELVLLGEAARDAQRPHARVFLADGDAMTLPFEHLKAICKASVRASEMPPCRCEQPLGDVRLEDGRGQTTRTGCEGSLVKQNALLGGSVHSPMDIDHLACCVASVSIFFALRVLCLGLVA